MDIVELFNDFFDVYAVRETTGIIKIGNVSMYTGKIITFDDVFRVYETYEKMAEFNVPIVADRPERFDYERTKYELGLIKQVAGIVDFINVEYDWNEYFIDGIKILNFENTLLCNHEMEKDVYYLIDQYEKLKALLALRREMVPASSYFTAPLCEGWW